MKEIVIKGLKQLRIPQTIELAVQGVKIKLKILAKKDI